MAELDISKTTTTDLASTVIDYEVDLETPDSEQEQKDTWYDFPYSSEYLGYYKNIPELKKAIDALAIWTVGKGVTTDNRTKVMLDNMTGWGEDSFISLMFNALTMKKALGDAFLEIIREGNRIINIKPLYTGDMRVVVDPNGIIKRYEQRTKGKPRKLQPNQVLHLSNDRIANEIHGTSVIEACKWVIDARNEAMEDYRKVLHRQLGLGVLYIDTENTTKRDALIAQYENAIKNGELLVLPTETAKLEDPNVTSENKIEWIRYLEGFFYQAVGIPKVIATSEDFTEAASKVGYMTFEPIYTHEQTQLEADLWNQTGIKVKFNRPPSLHGVMQESESKNTGQVGIQPNEIQPSITRTE